MTTNSIVSLESVRLMEYALPIDCYICNGQNNFDAEYCRYCAAPMALAHQARTEKTLPAMIACIGVSGVGKTVYLGMLMDMLSRRTEHLHLLARGAFSINLQQTTMSALARVEFPEKTPNEPDRWNWVHCEVRHAGRRRPLELIMPDMAGEAILEEIDHPHSFRVIGSFLTKSCGAMILIDTLRLVENAEEQDYFTMKLITYLGESEADNRRRGWRRRPVALVFTKADQCEECMNDPEGYARTHAPGLWQQCRERFGMYRFFAAGVAGACAYRQTRSGARILAPLRIEPHGIVEPFEWLIGNVRTKR